MTNVDVEQGSPLETREFRKVSEQLGLLANPQRSDTFYREFREAVRLGRIQAIFIGERFTLPKMFQRRGREGEYQVTRREMLFRATPEFEAWFDEINARLAATRRGAKVRPSLANIQAGLVDFDELARQTQAQLQANFEKGQVLGTSRGRRTVTAQAKQETKQTPAKRGAAARARKPS